MILWTVRVHWNMSVECIFQHLLISLKRFEFLHFLTHRPTLFLFSDWSCNGKENFGTSQETTSGSLFPIRNCHCKLLIISGWSLYKTRFKHLLICLLQENCCLVTVGNTLLQRKTILWRRWRKSFVFLCFLLNSSFMKWELKCLDTFLQSYISWDTQTQPPNETTYFIFLALQVLLVDFKCLNCIFI